MRHSVLIVSLTICACVPTKAFAQSSDKAKTFDVSPLMPRDKPFFVKADDHWEATYRAKSRSIVIQIIGVKEGDAKLLLLQTTLGSREDVPLSRNLAVKLLELNGHWDFAKVVLYSKFLALRVDYPFDGLDAAAVETMCSRLAASADAALEEIKNFLP